MGDGEPGLDAGHRCDRVGEEGVRVDGALTGRDLFLSSSRRHVGRRSVQSDLPNFDRPSRCSNMFSAATPFAVSFSVRTTTSPTISFKAEPMTFGQVPLFRSTVQPFDANATRIPSGCIANQNLSF